MKKNFEITVELMVDMQEEVLIEEVKMFNKLIGVWSERLEKAAYYQDNKNYCTWTYEECAAVIQRYEGFKRVKIKDLTEILESRGQVADVQDFIQWAINKEVK